MTRRHILAVVAIAVLMGSPLLRAQAAGVAGTWMATFESQAGEQQYTFELVVKGSELTGTAKGNLTGETPITEGKVEGGTISFVENASYQGMPLRITYTGKVTSADEIAFTRNVAEIASEQLVAKRAK
jgi:hypothetical protein